MDLGTTIVGLIIILICVIPFVLMSASRRKKEKRLILSLNELALQQGRKVSLQELWNENIIGLDESETMVFSIRKAKVDIVTQAINLADVQRCRLVKNSRTVKNNDSNFSVTEKLELAFDRNEKGKEDSIIEFYNIEFDSSTLMGELQIIEKWNKLLNEKISAMEKKK